MAALGGVDAADVSLTTWASLWALGHAHLHLPTQSEIFLNPLHTVLWDQLVGLLLHKVLLDALDRPSSGSGALSTPP